MFLVSTAVALSMKSSGIQIRSAKLPGQDARVVAIAPDHVAAGLNGLVLESRIGIEILHPGIASSTSSPSSSQASMKAGEWGNGTGARNRNRRP